MFKQKPLTLFLIVMLGFTFSFSCKKNGNDEPAVVPVVKIDDASQARMAAASVMHFRVSLNKKTTVDVSVDYTVVDGTAISPEDYTAASGTVTIPANQTQTELDVQIKGDPADTRENNLEFTVQLSHPKNCTLSAISSATGTIITENGTNLATDNAGYTTPLSYPGYTLVWNDEFSNSTLNSNVWSFETTNNNGWGNNELEYYTNSPKNIFISNGNLIIEARKESISGFNYSSARIKTEGKKTFTFGRIDIRAKLPVSKGIWPALWMLGSNIGTVGWPSCGEMDIMELIGTYPGRVHATMHWNTSGGTHASKGAEYNLASGNFSQQFHVFSMVWEQDLIKCYTDDVLYLTVTKADVGTTYPFNAPQFFIFNVAVGGNWPGPPDVNTEFPQRMFVDYVRVFQ